MSNTRGNGLATSYYELPPGATELGHIIAHKHMEHGIGEAFCALYRLNDNGEYLRNLNKVLYYVKEAIAIHEKREAARTTESDLIADMAIASKKASSKERDKEWGTNSSNTHHNKGQ